MIQSKKERAIAKIISINAYKLEAELLSSINSFNINDFDDIYQFIRLNGYVLVCIENNFIVASISSIREKEDNSTFVDKDGLSKINSNKILELFPMGILEKEKFTFGVSNYPNLYSDVLYIKEKELNALFGSAVQEKDKYLDIGTWTLLEKYRVKININNFFGLHSAILGNTGSGKSCTISSILQTIYKKNKYPKSKFIFFDVNGEYKKAFIKEEKEELLEHIELKCFDFKNKENNNNFYLPLNLLNIDEWELLLKASSKAQSPILRNALGLYSLCENQEDNDSNDSKNKLKTYIFCKISQSLLETDSNYTVSKIIANYNKLQNNRLQFFIEKHSFDNNKISTSCIKFTKEKLDLYLGTHYGEIKNCTEFKEYLSKLEQENTQEFIDFNYNGESEIKLDRLEEYIELAISWEEAHGNKQVRDYCSSMITRLKSLSTRTEFSFFKNKEDLDSYIEKFIKDFNISIINFDNIDDEVIEVVSSVLARIFFEYVKKLESRNTEPIHLILDEAHRYISNNKGKEYFFEANRIFERIAKEARKYGLLLMLSSQRPSELNETVLSQCSNFIIHRIQNPNDLNFIRAMTPFISRTLLEQLPSIPNQEALIFGTATNLPVLFKVKDANPLPKSGNNNIVKNWTEEIQTNDNNKNIA